MYIYPPRPKNKIPSSSLPTFQNLGFIGQPKMNGSCGVMFLDDPQAITVNLMNRHKERFSRYPISEEEFISLHRGYGKMILVGEYLNKSQLDINEEPLKGFVIFDIIMYNGEHLLGETQKERMRLLNSLYTTEEYDGFIRKINDVTFIVNQFDELPSTWEKMIKIDMYEGFVLKLPSGKLKNGVRPENNGDWQVKCRKPTKNYSY